MTAEQNENESENDERETPRLTVSINGALVGRIEELLDAPEFRFRDMEDFVRAALFSFCLYKERELSRIRREDGS